MDVERLGQAVNGAVDRVREAALQAPFDAVELAGQRAQLAGQAGGIVEDALA